MGKGLVKVNRKGKDRGTSRPQDSSPLASPDPPPQAPEGQTPPTPQFLVPGVSELAFPGLPVVRPTWREVLSKGVGSDPRLVSAQTSLCEMLAKIWEALNGEDIIFCTSQLLIKLPTVKVAIIVHQKVCMKIR